MNTDLTTPCGDCPFRSDITFSLHPARTQEILRAITDQQKTFACHRTLDYSQNDSGDTTADTQHCAGAMILLERLKRPNQWMRIMERLGYYDRHALKMDAPVFRTPQAMLRRMRRLHRSPLSRSRKEDA